MVVKIQDIAEIRSGVYFNDTPDGEVYVLQVKDFDAKGQPVCPLRPALELNDSVKKRFLSEGDLLFAAKGTTNFCAVYRNEPAPAVVSSSFLVLKIIRTEDVMPEYLCWFLNRNDVLLYFRNKMAGSVMPSITKAMLEAYEVEMPPVAVQEKIVAVAALQQREHALYEKITELRKMIINRQLINIVQQ
ncbi:MAG: restriction endonuclease subunit S [Bacteroidales bacterium]|jgi:restriction endonuclease S subunit|nr:restriction endonuclease subunit S [Bacteroidales bacterium]